MRTTASATITVALSEHQQYRLTQQAAFAFWTDSWSKRPFAWSIRLVPKEVDVWNGCVNYEWMLFNRLSIYLQVPIRNWTPPTDEQYAALKTANMKLAVLRGVASDGYELELADELKEAEAERDRLWGRGG